MFICRAAIRVHCRLERVLSVAACAGAECCAECCVLRRSVNGFRTV